MFDLEKCSSQLIKVIIDQMIFKHSKSHIFPQAPQLARQLFFLKIFGIIKI